MNFMISNVKSSKYLKYTSLSNTMFWDFYSLSNKNSITSTYPVIKLNEVLTHRKDNIIIDDNVIYKRCRVQIHAKGVVLRDEVIGKEIKTKRQQLCKANDFLVAEIDAKMGGYGIVPTSLENAIVSSHYFLFEIDKNKLKPEFLSLIIKQDHFFKQIKSTGSTNYSGIRPYNVLAYEIPLPPINEQIKLIKDYTSKQGLADSYIQKSLHLQDSVSEYLMNMLGSVETQQSKVKGLKIVNYNQIEKWGIDFIGIDFTNNFNFKEIKIKNLCKVSSGGTPSRSRKDFYHGGEIPWIKTGELNNDVIWDSEEKITIEGLKNSNAKLYPKNSLVVAMYGATIGKTAKLGIEASTNQACAVLYDINTSIINVDYLWEYLQTQTSNLKKLAYGSAQPNLNVGIISNLMIPLPPLEKQIEIAIKISSVKTQIKELNYLSSKNSEEANIEFGKKIFKD